MRERTVGRIIGRAVKDALDEYERIEAARTPEEQAAWQARTDRQVWLPLVRGGNPCDWRKESGPDTCMRCGEVRHHTRLQGLCKPCMRFMRKMVKSEAAAQ